MGCGCTKPLPGAFRQVANASQAAFRVVSAVANQEAVKATPETIEARLRSCSDCPECVEKPKNDRMYHRCAKCGCWLDGKFFAKAALITETCPLGKWGAS
jgi:hypothetical protein